MRKLFVVILALQLFNPGLSKECIAQDHLPEGYVKSAERQLWVDSVYNSLDSAQRISQLFIIRAWSDKDQHYIDSITEILVTFNPGGVCFFKGSPRAQINQTNMWLDSMKTPPLIAIDAEWGAGMRLDSAFSFPFQMTLGATRDDSLVFRTAKSIGRDCRRMGVQINFAPVVDVNNNPANPVINVRSFGEDPHLVAEMGSMFTKGLQSEGIIGFAKHFPGHGDTDTDSHASLPIILHPRERLDSVELIPFKRQINDGVKGIMVAHLFLPSYDTTTGIAATLSRRVITDLLKVSLGFKGYVITDALDMQGVTNYVKPGALEVQAFLAGNDILLLPQNLPVAINAIKAAADSLIIPWGMIDEKCKNILALKYDAGLSSRKQISTSQLSDDLNTRDSDILRREIYTKALTLLKNDDLVPLRNLDHKRIASVAITDSLETVFCKTLETYAPVTSYTVPRKTLKPAFDSLLRCLEGYDPVILSLHRMNLYPQGKFGITDDLLWFIDTLSSCRRTILVLFGNPYILDVLPGVSKHVSILVTYQDQPVAEELAGQALFGGVPVSGKVPVSVDGFPAGSGSASESTRIATSPPESSGIRPQDLAVIDSIAVSGIREMAYPGCQILFSMNSKVFYNKGFGNHDFSDSVKVTPNDMYDLASVTKVMATTLALMKLVDDGKIKPDDRVSDYLSELKRTDKEDLTIREILAHQAGFPAWLPFYLRTLIDGDPDPGLYSDTLSPEYPICVAKRLYLKAGYEDTLISAIIHTPLAGRGQYLYSDLGFYLLKRMVERITHQNFDEYLDTMFYRPMGVPTLGFNPLMRFPDDRICATELDTVFRKQLIQGYVHDQGAALLGGIAGHAGLFSNAFDLAALLQMLLNHGEYGGKQYLMPATIKEFTKQQFPETGNRRGLGFDKPPAHASISGPVCPSASQDSFGHSGFTGTYVWADPRYNLIYVFLSNRVNPSAENNRLLEMNIRTRIHEAMYQILANQKEK